MTVYLRRDALIGPRRSHVCQEPDCKPDAEFHEVLYRIVDADGHNAGYATPVRIMLLPRPTWLDAAYWQQVIGDSGTVV